MSGITTSVGLISGIDTGSLIDQLLAIEARPKVFVEQQNFELQQQQIAFQNVNANLLSLKLSASTFSTTSTFNDTTASSSNESIVGVTSGLGAVPGTYNLFVDKLVSTQQLMSDGFADSDTTAVAPSGGTLTFEFGPAELDTNTELSQLNGGEGIERGKIRITDRSGAATTVDLSKALKVDDVLKAINESDTINVTASVDGDRLVITDNTGSTNTSLTIADVGTTETATSLGIASSAAGDTLTGSVVNKLGENTALAILNDGNGVGYGSTNDFSITYGDAATTVNVNLSDVNTVGDIIDAIETATSDDIDVQVNESGGLTLVDNTSATSTVTVAALNSSTAAADLGLLGSTTGGGSHTGDRVLAEMNSKLLKNLNGGSGIDLSSVDITGSSGTSTIDLSAAASVSDVIDAINSDTGTTGVTAALNNSKNGIILTDASSGTITVAENGGTTAADLNLLGSHTSGTADSGNLQLQYISENTLLSSLNGGKGVSTGQFEITDGTGATATVDIGGTEKTIGEIIDEIDSRGLAITVGINDNGDGIVISHDLAQVPTPAVALSITEQGSTTAADLGLLGEAESTTADLNGSFEKTITIESTDTLDDVVSAINDSGIAVKANVINDGSTVNPVRLNLISEDAGTAGKFLFDDGGLDFGVFTLNEAEDSVIFYGSSDPARAVAVTSTTNTFSQIVPGAKLDAISRSDEMVQITISKDTQGIVDTVSSFVDSFNNVVDTFDEYDFYNADTEQRGILLSDFTIANTRNALYRTVINRDNDLTGSYTSFSSIGITIGSGAKMRFDQTKFLDALSADSEAVERLFTFKEEEEDEDGNTVITADGIGVALDTLLESITDADGPIQRRLDLIDSQILNNNNRIEDIDDALERKRQQLQAQFVAMEQTLAELQAQGNALGGLQALPPITTG